MVLIAMTACTSLDCPLNNTVYTKYKLRGENSLLADTLTISTVKVTGEDSVLLNRAVDVDSFILPMSYSRAADTLYMDFRDNKSGRWMDTVVVEKLNHTHFEDVDCKPSFFHTITSVHTTHNRIDSIVINRKDVTYDYSTPHFYIYFNTGY